MTTECLDIPWQVITDPGHSDSAGQHITWLKGVDRDGKPTWYVLVPASAIDQVRSRPKRELVGPSYHLTGLRWGTIGLPAADLRPYRETLDARHAQRPVCLELYAYLTQYAAFRPRTYDTLLSLRNRAIAWCKEFKLASQGLPATLALTVAMAFRMSASERDALDVLRDPFTSQDMDDSIALASGKPFETVRWSLRGWMQGRHTLGAGLGRVLGRFSNPRVAIPLPPKK